MQVPKHFKPHPMLALLTAMGASSLIANPQAPQVINGQATLVQNGNTLTVTNTPGTIINWQQFNIGRGELTRFVQQSAASQVLNRVVGVDPSTILGTLQSNGRVFLINPNGIVFGAGSQVDVAGLVASTLRLSNEDFLNQRLRFTETPGAGGIKNEGTLRSAVGGEILLIAPRIDNSGLINAPDGKILLAAGRTVEVADIDKPAIRVEITNTDEEAVNLGTLMARHISIYGALVRNSGRIQANSATVGENGKVVLRATRKVELTPSSVIEATGAAGTTGGEIDILASNTLGLNGGGEVLVQGVLSVRSVLEPTILPPLTFPEQNKPQVPVNNQLLATQSIAKNALTRSPDSGTTNLEIVPAPIGPSGDIASPQVLQANALPGPIDPVTPAPAPVDANSLSVPLVPANSPGRPEPFVPALPAGPTSPSPSPVPSGAGYGVGGTIRVSARGRVVVGDEAVLDASGPNGGGTIMVGGGWQGLNPNIITSNITYIAKTATLYANADLRGNGGLVVVWANDTAQIYGRIGAKGGALGGDGGSIETSGKRMLNIADGWIADASAGTYADGHKGKAGLWLLDPNNVIVQATGSDTNVTGNPDFTTTADSAIITTATIQAALNAGINVTITTSAGGAQAGDITLSSAITTNSASDVSLTMSAHNNINISASISATGTGKLNLVLNANSDATGGGAATLTSSATLALKGGTISSGNGTTLNTTSGTLNQVVLATNLNVNGTTNYTGGLTLNGVTITLNNAAFDSQSTQSITGTGNIVFGSTGTSYLRGVNTAQTLTIGSGITISGSTTGTSYLGYYAGDTIALNGTVTAGVAGRTWNVGTMNIGATGVFNVSAGTVNLGQAASGTASWSNTGNINASGGTLNLDGNFTRTGIETGHINQSGTGVVQITGNLNLQAGLLNLSTLGLTSLNIASGGANDAVTGGGAGNELTANAGFSLTSSSGELVGVKLGTNLQVNSTTYYSGGLDLNGVTITLNNAAFDSQSTQSITGTGNIVFGSTGTSYLRGVNTAQTLTIGSGITISGSTTGTSYLGYYAGDTIALNGTVTAGVAGRTWNVGTMNIGATGVFNVSAGTVNLGQAASGTASWSNTGNINASGGTLNLDGNFTRTGIETGHINQSGTGVVQITGNLNLQAGLLNLSTLGLTSLNIASGGANDAVTGGGAGNELTANAGFSLTSSSGELVGVKLGTNLQVNSTTYYSGGLDLNGVTITLNNAAFDSQSTQSITGTGNIVFGSTGTSYLRGVNTAQTLTIGSGITISGSTTGTSYLGYYAGDTIALNGTVTAGVAGRTWNVGTMNIGATGVFNVSAGTVNLGQAASGTASWSNTGNINASGGTLNLDGNFTRTGIETGHINQSGTGVVQITGNLNLQAGLLNLSTLGLTSLNIASGGANDAVTGGGAGNELTANAGFSLTSSSGELVGVKLGTNLQVNSTTYYSGGLDLNGVTITLNNAAFDSQSTQSITGTGNIVFGSTGTSYLRGVNTAQTLTIGSGITISGSTTGTSYLGYYAGDTIALNGTVTAGVAGRTWNVGTMNIGATGVFNVSAGTVNLGQAASGTASWSNTGNINASGGTLNLDGNFTTVGIGAINSLGGTVNLTGTLNNVGNVFDIAVNGTLGAAGLSLLSNATITGGTLISSDGTALSVTGTLYLNAVTIGSNLTHTGGFLRMLNGLTLANGVTVNKGSTQWGFDTAGAVSLSTPGSATLITSGGNIYAGYGAANTLTIASGITISGYTSFNQSSAATIVNNGSIIINGVGQTSTINLNSFTNVGLLSVTSGTFNVTPTSWSSSGTISASGGTLTLSGTNLSNTGSLNLSGSAILNLDGNANITTLGTLTRAAGTSINITGNFTIGTGNTLDIGAGGIFKTGGLTSLSNGVIIGGTLISGDTTALNVVGTGYLDGVTIGSNLTHTGGFLRMLNGLTLANGVTVNKGSTQWGFDTAGAVSLSTPGSATLITSGGNIYAGYGAANTLTIASGITISGYTSFNQSSAATIVNNGSIIINGVGQTSTINLNSFTNVGLLSVTSGTFNVTPTSWSSSGTISASGGTLTLSGTNLSNTGSLNLSGSAILNLDGNANITTLGTLTRAAGTSINITGNFTIGTGNTLDIGAGGIFKTGGLTSLSNGVIIGGTLISGDTTALNVVGTGYLDGVTIGSNMTHTGGFLRMLNGLTLANGVTVNKGSTQWGFDTAGAVSLSTPGSATLITSGGNIYAGYGAANTLTIASGITISGYTSFNQSSAATIVNNGSIIASGVGQTTTIAINSFVNNGTVGVSAGTLSTNASFSTNAGTIFVSSGAVFSRTNLSFTNNGTLLNGGNISIGTGTLTNNGILNPGASPGFSTITGNLTLSGTSVINIEMAGYARGIASGYDAIHVTGNVTLGGTVNVLETGGFVAALGDVFHIVSAGGALSGTFATVVPPNGLEPFALGVDSKNAYLQRGLAFTGVNVWNTDSSGNFNVASNWSAGVVPGATDTIIIDRGPNANPVVTITSAISVNKLTTTESVTVASGGTLLVSSDAVFGANLTLQSGGTLTLNGLSNVGGVYTQTAGTLGGLGNLTLATASFTSGSLSGTGQLTTTGVVSVGDITLSKVWNAQGSTSMTAANIVRFNTGTINNSGTFSLDGTQTAPLLNNSGTNAFNNTGTLNKTTATVADVSVAFNNAATGIVTVNGGTLGLSGTGTDAGNYTVASGATLNLASTRSFGTGSGVAGAGLLQVSSGTVDFNAGSTLGIATTGSFLLSSGTANFNLGTTNFVNGLSMTAGTLGGSSNISAATATLTNGVLSGTGQLTTTGVVSVGDITLSKVWNAQGSTSMTAANIVRFNTGTINNSGTFSLDGTQTAPLLNNSGTNAFNNTGTLNKTTATVADVSVAFNNAATGIVTVNGGTLGLSGTGTDAGNYTVASGATLNLASTRSFGTGSGVAGAGLLQVSSGTVDFNAGSTLGIATTGSFLLSSGTANFNLGTTNFVNGLSMTAGTLGGSSNISAATATLTNGVLSGTGQLTTTGVVSVGDITLSKVWNAQGSTSMTAANIVRFNTGTINNSGTFSLDGTQTAPLLNNSGTNAFNNTGTLNKTTATVADVSVAFNNAASGIVTVNGGTLNISGSLTQNGTIRVAGGGAVFSKSGGFTNSGVLAGSGTYDVTGGALVNTGIIRPDGGGADATGTMDITGNFTQTAGGLLDLQVEGNAVGQFDRLAVSGNATLDGTVNLTAINGFIPVANQNLGVMTYASQSGSFATLNGTGFTGLVPAYGATGFTLAQGSGCAVDDCWIGTSGDWSIGSNWSTGAAPTAGQRVQLNVAGNQTITITGGSYSLLDLISDENLVLASGNLTTLGTLTMNSGTTLTITGGALVANGGFTAPVVNLSSGSFGGSGSIAVTSDFNQTGGTFNPTGSLDLMRSLGHFNIGSLTTSGAIRLVTVGAFDIVLNGSLLTSASGLADNVAAISVNAGRDIGITSTSNVTSTTSGAIVLAAAGVMDLKINDGGSNGSNTDLAAAGNLQLTAGGAIYRGDGNAVSLAAKVINVSAGSTLGNLGGAITASTGDVNLTAASGMTVNTATATLGAIDLQSGTGALSVGSLSAGTSITAHSGATMSMGPLTSGSGPISLATTGTGSHLVVSSITSGTGLITLATSGASDITLNGNVQTSIAGLADNVAAISVNAGRDIGITSTSNVTSTTSGAIVLAAAGVMDLKINDGGSNGSNTALSAAGNLQLNAGGSIYRSDNNAFTAIGQSIDLTYGSTLDPAINLTPIAALNITQSVGNLTLTSSSQAVAQRYSTLSGDIIFAPGASFTGGPITVGGNGIAQFNSGAVSFANAFASNMPVVVAGATVNFNDSGAQVISGGTWNINNGVLNLPAAGASVAAGSALVVASGTVAFATGGAAAFTNAGTVTAGSNLMLPGDFTNLTGATANLTNTTIGGNLYNSGTFNVSGLVTVAGPVAQQLDGLLNLPIGAQLDMSNPAGQLSWIGGTIAGQGSVNFSGGGTFNFAGNGDRVIDGLNFGFNNLTLPNGSLTVKSGSLTLSGSALLPDGVGLYLEGGTLNNLGTLDVAGTFGLSGGNFAGSGSLSMSGSGNMNLPSGNAVNWTNTGPLANTATLNLAGTTIPNAITNTGTINMGSGLTFAQPLTNAGVLVATAGSNVQFTNGLTQQPGSALVLSGGSVTGEITMNGGVIKGSGTVNGNVTVGSGVLAPGFSPGAITISGNLVMNSASVLNIELGGLTQGTEYDWINVTGSASLAGTLNVMPYNGYTPPAGSSYSFMNFAASSGSFTNVNLSNVAGWVFSQQAQSLLLSVNALAAAPTLLNQPASLIQTLVTANPVLVAESRLLTVAELTIDLSKVAEDKSKSVVEREPDLEVCP